MKTTKPITRMLKRLMVRSVRIAAAARLELGENSVKLPDIDKDPIPKTGDYPSFGAPDSPSDLCIRYGSVERWVLVNDTNPPSLTCPPDHLLECLANTGTNSTGAAVLSEFFRCRSHSSGESSTTSSSVFICENNLTTAFTSSIESTLNAN